MPPAKKSAARSTRRTGSQAKAITAASRAQLERAIKTLDKSLDDARDALTSLGKNASHSGQRRYKDLGGTLKILRSESQKANRSLTTELEKLRAAATPGRSTTRRATGARKTAAKSTTARKTTAAKPAAKSTARSGARRTSSRSSSGRGRRAG
jgi:DNA-binding protein HU-beta